MNRRQVAGTAPLALLLAIGQVAGTACGNDGSGDGFVGPFQITTVLTRFTPMEGGDPVSASYIDPDGPGDLMGHGDSLSLQTGVSYRLEVELLDEFADPIANVTDRVRSRAQEYQVFVRGNAVSGPAVGDNPNALTEHAYADQESDYVEVDGESKPVGLVNRLTTYFVGSESLDIVVWYSEDKAPDMAETLAAGGDIAGDEVLFARFPLTVQ